MEKGFTPGSGNNGHRRTESAIIGGCRVSGEAMGFLLKKPVMIFISASVKIVI